MTTVQNESVSSFTDLITKLDTYMQTIGWTSEELDVTTTVTTGGEWAMLMTGTNVRFAASWDGAGTPSNLAIYQYVDQVYDDTIRPWEQDNDSGNGDQAKADAGIVDERHVIIGTAPIQYWAFSHVVLRYTYIVVETASGIFAHFGFGELDKRGDWTGGEFCYGQRNNLNGQTGGAIDYDGTSFLLDGYFNGTGDAGGPVDDDSASLLAATIHCEGLPSQPANGQWAVNMGGSAGAQAASFGSDRQSNDGASSDIDRVLFTDGLRAGPWVDGFVRTNGADLSGETRMWPISMRYVDTTTGDTYGPMGFVPEVFGCSIANGRLPGDVIVDENDESYYIFPAHQRWPGSGSTDSGYLGIAYRTATPIVDPDDLPELTARWDFSNSGSVTITSGKVSQLDDISPNTSHFLQGTAARRPSIVQVNGMDMGDMGADVDDIFMSVVSNINLVFGSGSCSFFYIYRCTDNVKLDLNTIFAKGFNPLTGRYASMVSWLNDHSAYTDYGDTALNAIVVQDTSELFDDSTVRLYSHQINRDTDELQLWSNGVETSFSGGSISGIGSSDSTQVLFLGKLHQAVSDQNFIGEIGEIVFFKGLLSDEEIVGVNNFLMAKWGIT